jgi:hypothetical protein
MRPESALLFSYRILPAVLAIMLAGRSWASYFPIHIPPNRRLSEATFSINLIIPFTKYFVGY